VCPAYAENAAKARKNADFPKSADQRIGSALIRQFFKSRPFSGLLRRLPQTLSKQQILRAPQQSGPRNRGKMASTQQRNTLTSATCIFTTKHTCKPAGQLLEKSKRLVSRVLLLKREQRERAAKSKSSGEGGGRDGGGAADAGEGAVMEEGDGRGGQSDWQYEAERTRSDYDMDLCATQFKSRLLELLDWRKPLSNPSGDSVGARRDHPTDEGTVFSEWSPGDTVAQKVFVCI